MCVCVRVCENSLFKTLKPIKYQEIYKDIFPNGIANIIGSRHSTDILVLAKSTYMKIYFFFKIVEIY